MSDAHKRIVVKSTPKNTKERTLVDVCKLSADIRKAGPMLSLIELDGNTGVRSKRVYDLAIEHNVPLKLTSAPILIHQLEAALDRGLQLVPEVDLFLLDDKADGSRKHLRAVVRVIQKANVKKLSFWLRAGKFMILNEGLANAVTLEELTLWRPDTFDANKVDNYVEKLSTITSLPKLRALTFKSGFEGVSGSEYNSYGDAQITVFHKWLHWFETCELEELNLETVHGDVNSTYLALGRNKMLRAWSIRNATTTNMKEQGTDLAAAIAVSLSLRKIYIRFGAYIKDLDTHFAVAHEMAHKKGVELAVTCTENKF